jgi:hypothetical protein
MPKTDTICCLSPRSGHQSSTAAKKNGKTEKWVVVCNHCRVLLLKKRTNLRACPKSQMANKRGKNPKKLKRQRQSAILPSIPSLIHFLTHSSKL